MHTESKRQKQVAGLINEELNSILLRMGLTMIHGGMLSISNVKITPDLYEARVYLSLFQINDAASVLKTFEEKNKEIRKELGQRVRHQLRIVPEIKFFLDDTLEYVFKMEQLFDQIRKESNPNEAKDHPSKPDAE